MITLLKLSVWSVFRYREILGIMFLKVKKYTNYKYFFLGDKLHTLVIYWDYFKSFVRKLWVELRKSLAAMYFAFENVQYGKGKSSDYNSNFPHSQLCIIKRGQRPLPWLNFDRMYVLGSLLWSKFSLIMEITLISCFY